MFVRNEVVFLFRVLVFNGKLDVYKLVYVWRVVGYLYEKLILFFSY